jgi:hypothetical protein
MFSYFRQGFRQWARSGTSSGAQKAPVRRLQCEALEDRILPSVTGTEILVNTSKVGLQSQAVTATSSNGMSVVVWTDFNKTHYGIPTRLLGDDGNIKAQLFNAAGQKVGGEILVAGGRSPHHHPTVAMDSHGNFAVAWVLDYDATDTDIHAARFFANGTRNGSEFAVAQTPKREYDPSVGMDAAGDFVVSYTYQFASNDSDIHANLYHANGSLERQLDVAITTAMETHSRVAMRADGHFAVAFVQSNDIFLQRYDQFGNLTGKASIASSSVVEQNPDVAMDNTGHVLVVWQALVNNNWNVYGRFDSPTGVLGSTFSIATTTAQETNPEAAIDSLTGKFAVAYQTHSGTSTNINVAEYSSSHTPVRNSTALYGCSNPDFSEGGSGHLFHVVGDSLGSKGGDPSGGIFARFGIL